MMSKEIFHPGLSQKTSWYIISYFNQSESLIGGTRTTELNKFLKNADLNSVLITRKKIADDQIEIKENSWVYFFRRILNHIFLDSSIIWACKVFGFLKNKGEFVLVTSSPPHGIHFLGLLCKGFKINTYWLADFRDPLTLNTLYKAMPHEKFFNKKFEKIVFRKADKVVFNTNMHAEAYYVKYPNVKSKSIVVSNGFDEDYESVCDKKYDWKIFVYAGGLYKDGIALDICNIFFNKMKIFGLTLECHFYGEYNPKIGNIQAFTYMARAGQHQIPKILRKYKFGIVALPEKFIGSGTIAAKFLDYVGAGLIPVCINPSEQMRRIMRKLGYGVEVFNDTDYSSIVSKVESLENYEVDLNKTKEFSRAFQFTKLLENLNLK